MKRPEITIKSQTPYFLHIFQDCNIYFIHTFLLTLSHFMVNLKWGIVNQNVSFNDRTYTND